MDWAGSIASGTGYCLCRKSMFEDTIGHRARYFLYNGGVILCIGLYPSLFYVVVGKVDKTQ
jgi:hypothetical protein